MTDMLSDPEVVAMAERMAAQLMTDPSSLASLAGLAGMGSERGGAQDLAGGLAAALASGESDDAIAQLMSAASAGGTDTHQALGRLPSDASGAMGGGGDDGRLASSGEKWPHQSGHDPPPAAGGGVAPSAGMDDEVD